MFNKLIKKQIFIKYFISCVFFKTDVYQQLIKENSKYFETKLGYKTEFVETYLF